MAYITQQDLEDRVGAKTVRRILDDNRDGQPDAGPLFRVIEDSESKVEGALAGVYTTPFVAPIPNEIRRITLDVACAYLAQRYPSYVRLDSKELMRMAHEDLDRLRKGTQRMNSTAIAPEPRANEGAHLITAADDPCPQRFAIDGTGLF